MKKIFIYYSYSILRIFANELTFHNRITDMIFDDINVIIGDNEEI